MVRAQQVDVALGDGVPARVDPGLRVISSTRKSPGAASARWVAVKRRCPPRLSDVIGAEFAVLLGLALRLPHRPDDPAEDPDRVRCGVVIAVAHARHSADELTEDDESGLVRLVRCV
jgi:hypothetical protein